MGGGLGESSGSYDAPSDSAPDPAPAVEPAADPEVIPESAGEQPAENQDMEQPEDGAEEQPADGGADPKPGDYAYLLAQYNDLLAKTGGAPVTDEGALDATPDPQAIPKNALPGEMPPIVFDLTEEEADAAGFVDRDAAHSVLTKAMGATVAQTQQWFEEQASKMVLKNMNESFRNLHIGEMFFDKYPHLEQYGALVSHTISQIKNANPALTSRQVMAEVERVVGPIVEKAGRIAPALDATTRGNPPSQKTSGGGGTVRGARAMSATEQVINRMAQSSNQTATDPELAKLGII